MKTDPRQSRAPSLRLSLLIASGFLATTLAQTDLLKLPLQRLLKDDLGVAPAMMANFFGVATVGWYLKPLMGLLSDSFPLLGTRRRHYLIGSSMFAGLGWLAMGYAPRGYVSLLLAGIVMNLMLSTASTVMGALLVEGGQDSPAVSGRLVALRNFVEGGICVLLAGPLAGFLATLPFEQASWAGAAIAASVVPVAWLWLKEPDVSRRDRSALRDAGRELKELLASPPMWIAALILLIVTVAPGLPTVLFFYQRDTLGLTTQQIGDLGIAAGGGSIFASILYGFISGRMSLRARVALGVICAAAGTFAYLFYRSYTAAIAVEALNGFLGILAIMAFMELAVWATPSGGAALGFALLMGVLNLGNYVSDVAGASLVASGLTGFFDMVWIKAGLTLVSAVGVLLLPLTQNARSSDAISPA